jgi:Tfp pilus assembly protein PilF
MAEAPATLLARAAAHYAAGEYDAAATCAAAIVAQEPKHFDALHLLGVLCLGRNRLADAACYLERAAQLNAGVAQVNLNRANAWLALKQPARAEALSRAMLRAQPDHADALNNLGAALGQLGRGAEAIEAFRRAVRHAPDHLPSRFNLAAALEKQGQLAEAAETYRATLERAYAVAPAERIATVARCLGFVLVELGRPEEALALLRAVQVRRTEPLELTWYESLLHLRMGDFEAGWRGYEHRWQIAEFDKPPEGATVPDIDNLAGKRVLLMREQGRGDIIQFARYAPLLTERGATVYMSVYDDLKSLLAMMPDVAGVVGEDELEPAHDIVTPFLSLPLAFGTTVTTIPANVPYLHADPGRVRDWKSRLDRGSRHIGLAWASTNPGATRSTSLSALAGLFKGSSATWHALQKEIDAADLDFLMADHRILDHRAALTDFAETAALIEALDLVISIDTGVAHLAGALGKPVWIMLPHVGEWRWLQERTDSPWYPTARLFRQPAPGDWDGLVKQVVAALEGDASHR